MGTFWDNFGAGCESFTPAKDRDDSPIHNQDFDQSADFVPEIVDGWLGGGGIGHGVRGRAEHEEGQHGWVFRTFDIVVKFCLTDVTFVMIVDVQRCLRDFESTVL